jgi:hypothetical protein
VKTATKIKDALKIIQAVGLPDAQHNERSALCLLAITGITKKKTWAEAGNPLIGITPIMDFAREHYGKDYAPNTRETVRRQTMHQFVSAGIALYNPDNPGRPVNSPKAVYQISSEALALVRTYGKDDWAEALRAHLTIGATLAQRYGRARQQAMVSLRLKDGAEVKLSPGEHSQLIADIVHQFGPRFAPNANLIYAGDTGDKWGYFDRESLSSLGVTVDSHGKMPDVVLYDNARDWLLLIESVTSHGPVNAKRHAELEKLFSSAKPGCVYVTAFPNRSLMARYLQEIAWETEVWVADSPSHMIHFNGDRFLGPH